MRKVTWLIPGLLKGSGGHRTILQHADYLQAKGYRCILHVENPERRSRSELKRLISSWFGYQFEEVYSGWDRIEPSDMVFATVWYSAKFVRHLPFESIKCYFVQDFEALFNPMGDGYLMAENSYKYGLHPICIGRWLPSVLKNRFNLASDHFDFCADLSTYFPKFDKPRDKAVCFIYQPEKPRRCARLGLEALEIVKRVVPQAKIILFGSAEKGLVPFEHENLGLISLDECNALYNRCQVGLCISSSNPSRIPFEMMAAGLPVVEVYRENNLYDFNEEATLLCEPTAESLATGLIKLLTNPVEARAMGEAGAKIMADRNLELGLRQFHAAVENLIKKSDPKNLTPQLMYKEPPLEADLVSFSHFGIECRGSQIPSGPRFPWLPLFLRKPIRMIKRQLSV